MAKDDSPLTSTGLAVCTGSFLQALWSPRNKVWKQALPTGLKHRGEVRGETVFRIWDLR